MKVAETEPMIKGAFSAQQAKSAVMETGLWIQVPFFFEAVEDGLVDTKSLEYSSRT